MRTLSLAAAISMPLPPIADYALMPLLMLVTEKAAAAVLFTRLLDLLFFSAAEIEERREKI